MTEREWLSFTAYQYEYELHFSDFMRREAKVENNVKAVEKWRGIYNNALDKMNAIVDTLPLKEDGLEFVVNKQRNNAKKKFARRYLSREKDPYMKDVYKYWLRSL